MIHVFIGTKAQFIKMAPVMQELERRRIAYNFIDAGQHGGLTSDLIQQFELRAPDVLLRSERANIVGLGEAVAWAAKNIARAAFRSRQAFKELFRSEGGICLIHGDTLTTLLSLFYARRCGIKVAHIEAGLRSHDLFNPFPEEIIRLVAMRYSDLLFAPSDWAAENLRQMGCAWKAVKVGGNTVADAVRYARENINGKKQQNKPYVVASIHRVENIYSRSRLTAVVALMERIALERQVIFVLHEPTRSQLARFDLEHRLLRNQMIQMLPLQSYLTFIGLLASADFIVTDGGSVQEESYFLDVPCLVMRKKTERQEGLGQNVLLAGFEKNRVDQFLRSFSALRRAETCDDLSPSRTIVDHLLAWA